MAGPGLGAVPASIAAALANRGGGMGGPDGSRMPYNDQARQLLQRYQAQQIGAEGPQGQMALPPVLQRQVDAGALDYNTAFQRAFANRAGFRGRAMDQVGQGPAAGGPTMESFPMPLGQDGMQAKPMPGGFRDGNELGAMSPEQVEQARTFIGKLPGVSGYTQGPPPSWGQSGGSVPGQGQNPGAMEVRTEVLQGPRGVRANPGGVPAAVRDNAMTIANPNAPRMPADPARTAEMAARGFRAAANSNPFAAAGQNTQGQPLNEKPLKPTTGATSGDQAARLRLQMKRGGGGTQGGTARGARGPAAR